MEKGCAGRCTLVDRLKVSFVMARIGMGYQEWVVHLYIYITDIIFYTTLSDVDVFSVLHGPAPTYALPVGISMSHSTAPQPSTAAPPPSTQTARPRHSHSTSPGRTRRLAGGAHGA
jgi:hypothetical protein